MGTKLPLAMKTGIKNNPGREFCSSDTTPNALTSIVLGSQFLGFSPLLPGFSFSSRERKEQVQNVLGKG